MSKLGDVVGIDDDLSETPVAEEETAQDGGAECGEQGAFRVRDERSADWFLEKLGAIDDEERRIKGQAATRLAELKADRERLHNLFDADLREWASGETARRRRKTITLLHGSVLFRSCAERLSVCDVDAALPHAASLGCVTTVTRVATESYLDKAAELLRETGEMLPGVETVPAGETFSIKVGRSNSKAGGLDLSDLPDLAELTE